jgi:hypothetical protein
MNAAHRERATLRPSGRTTLLVIIDKDDTLAQLGQGAGQVDGQGALAGASLEVAHGHNMRLA